MKKQNLFLFIVAATITFSVFSMDSDTSESDALKQQVALLEEQLTKKNQHIEILESEFLNPQNPTPQCLSTLNTVMEFGQVTLAASSTATLWILAQQVSNPTLASYLQYSSATSAALGVACLLTASYKHTLIKERRRLLRNFLLAKRHGRPQPDHLKSKKRKG